jgi:putative RNA 2'-phosphotransferase
MLLENQNTDLSKLLSSILRHKPSTYEIVLDENGSTNVDDLISRLKEYNENSTLK